jgi:hypothetical protein
MGKIDFDKFLIDYANSGFLKKRMLVNYLLEQQGLQIVKDKIVPIKDKKEPKFKVGDKVVNDGKVCTIKIVNEDNYIVNNGERDIQVHFSYTKDWKLVEQKPAWSEEYEKMLNGIIEASTHHCYLNITDIDWLKSLKERYTWKPSDEQMEALRIARDRNDKIGFYLSQLYDDLKKLM